MAPSASSRQLSAYLSRRQRPDKQNEPTAIELLAKSAITTVNNPQDSANRPRRSSRVPKWLTAFESFLFGAWKRRPEQPKVAIHEDRGLASVQCLVHILPVGGSIALFVLNASGTFVGARVWSQLTTVLQYVAKMHEMLMVSSLAVVFCSYLCHHLLGDKGLPFGAAVASAQMGQLKFLLSPELLASFRTKSFNKLFKLHLLPTLIIFPLLVGTVGPASAVCMIPRLAPWLVQNQIVGLGNTAESLFPTQIQYGESLALDWSFTEVDTYIRLAPIFSYYGPARYTNTSVLWSFKNVSAPLTLYVQTVNPASNSSGLSTASTSIQNPAIAGILYPTGEPWTLEDSMDAFSNVSCTVEDDVTWNSTDSSVSPPLITFSTAPGGPLTGRIADPDADAFRQAAESWTATSSGQQVLLPYVVFVELPNTNATGAVYATASLNPDGDTMVVLHPCTAMLGWHVTDMRYTGQTVQSREVPLHIPDSNIRATHMNLNQSTATTILPASTYSDSYWLFTDPQNLPSAIPLAISVILTITLAKASGTINANGLALCNLQTGYCPGAASQFKYSAYRNGYGYGTELSSVRFSLAILILYCLIAISHTVYAIYTGRSSTAWDSMSELLALGLTSRPPAELSNTCTGIETAQVFENRVRIAVTMRDDVPEDAAFESIGNHIELVFASTEGCVVSKVKANRQYGDPVA